MNLKSFEFAWRTAWMRVIAASMPGPRRAVPPDWRARPYRVLYVRYDAVGDLIIATGVIRAIAQSHPTLTVDVLASDRNHEVLHGNPHVRRVLRIARGGRRDVGERRQMLAVLRELRAAAYDVVVDGRIDQPRAFTTTPLLIAGTRAPYRVGAAAAHGRLVYNLPVPSLPKTVSYTERASFLAEPFGVERAATSFRPELFLSAAERGRAEAHWHEPSEGGAPRAARLLVNLSTSSSQRRWPDDRFVAVLRRARELRPDLRLRVIALPNEWESARAVAAAVGGAAAATDGVRAALAMVGTADLVFTPDTAISHAAAAFDRPAVVMIPGAGIGYAPYTDRARLVVAEGKELRALEVEPVRDAIEWLVRQ
jgi:ADP-heptose:LPS heptosyltransferase